MSWYTVRRWFRKFMALCGWVPKVTEEYAWRIAQANVARLTTERNRTKRFDAAVSTFIGNAEGAKTGTGMVLLIVPFEDWNRLTESLQEEPSEVSDSNVVPIPVADGSTSTWRP